MNWSRRLFFIWLMWTSATQCKTLSLQRFKKTDTITSMIYTPIEHFKASPFTSRRKAPTVPIRTLACVYFCISVYVRRNCQSKMSAEHQLLETNYSCRPAGSFSYSLAHTHRSDHCSHTFQPHPLQWSWAQMLRCFKLTAEATPHRPADFLPLCLPWRRYLKIWINIAMFVKKHLK